MPDPLARTLSPGDLALAAGAELETLSLVCDSSAWLPPLGWGVVLIDSICVTLWLWFRVRLRSRRIRCLSSMSWMKMIR